MSDRIENGSDIVGSLPLTRSMRDMLVEYGHMSRGDKVFNPGMFNDLERLITLETSIEFEKKMEKRNGRS